VYTGPEPVDISNRALGATLGPVDAQAAAAYSCRPFSDQCIRLFLVQIP
jgi:hypothetical protein